MDKIKRCMLCGAEPASVSCPMCGRVVGPSCLAMQKKVCKACLNPNQ